MAPKKNPKSKSNIQAQTSQSQDMFNQLFETYPSPPGSSSQPHPMGFMGYASHQPTFQHFAMAPPFQGGGYMPSFGSPIQTPIQGGCSNRLFVDTPDTDEDEEVEETEDVQETQEVPETQQASQTQGRKGKKKVACPKVPWTDEESRILAICYVSVSENAIIGNSQSSQSFWGDVRRLYNSQVTEQRRPDQISGKWGKMSKDVKLFIAIHSKLQEHWQSGAAGEDIMKHARAMFKKQTKRNFVYEEAWLVLKDCQKFVATEGVMDLKRARVEEDPFNVIDVEDEPPVQPNTSQFESLFRDDRSRRPAGREAAKASRSSTSSDAASRLSREEARLKLLEVTEASASITNKTMEELAHESKTRTMFKGLKLLAKPIPDNLDPEDRELLMLARQNIRKKYASQLRAENDQN